MPLALLLQETIGALNKGAKKLVPWAAMAYMEELLIDRARGAFVVHWFGAGLPLEGLSVRIAIANLTDLQLRFNAVLAERNRRLTSTGLNLTEPLAGIAGVMAGMLVSPTAQILLMVAVEEDLTVWWHKLLLILNLLSGGLLVLGVGLVGGGLALPGALLGAAVMLESDPEPIRHGYNFLGALAQVLDAAQNFIDLLLGPRDAVRNPLLRDILNLADNISNITITLIGAFALIITKIGPLLSPFAQQLQAFSAFLTAVVQIIQVLVTDVIERIKALYEGNTSPFSVILRLVDGLIQGLSPVGSGLGSLMTEIAAFFTWSMQQTQRALSGGLSATEAGWFSTIELELTQAFQRHETVQIILRLIDIFKTAKPYFTSEEEESSSSSGGAIDRILTPPTLPDFPDLPQLPTVAALSTEIGPPVPLNLRSIFSLSLGTAITRAPTFFAASRELQTAAQQATRPRSYFTAERRRLTAELNRSPGEELNRLYQQALPFRQALLDVIANQSAEIIPTLRDVFAQIDRYIYQQNDRPNQGGERRSLFPVRTVPAVSHLRPDIGELRVRITGIDRSAASEWGESLQSALMEQTYPVATVAQ